MFFFSLEILWLKGGICMQEFYCKTKIISGANALDWLNAQCCRRLLLVTDPYFQQNGLAQTIAGRVQAERREIFAGVKPDPTVELAAEGTALMRQLQPDLLIALGGGSAMDTAKAMRNYAGAGETFVAIPTTSGSGSEVTNFSVLTHEAVKYPLIHPKMQPDVAIIADELVQTLPPKLVAEGGFDVLSHALEAVAATKADAVSRALAQEAFCTAFSQLLPSFRGDTRVRGAVHLASTMAGVAFSQAGLGVCHALAHGLGGLFHLPHGMLNAILLPEVVAINAPVAGAAYGKLARMAGIGAASDTMSVRNLRNALIRLRKELHLPATLQEAGIHRQKLTQHMEKILETAIKDPCMSTNPVKAERSHLRSLLEAVAGRG